MKLIELLILKSISEKVGKYQFRNDVFWKIEQDRVKMLQYGTVSQK